MSSEAPPASEDALTADRSERKFLVDPNTAIEFAQLFDQELVAHHHPSDGEPGQPWPQDFTTTIYFDTASWDLFHRAQSNGQNTKLRGREYYSLNPSQARPIHFTPILWLEVKYKDGERVQKRRIGVPKRAVPGFFVHGEITAELIELQKPSYGEEARLVLDEVVSVCQQFAEPLRASCVVNYSRRAWQNQTSDVRVTLDRAISFFAPSDELWSRDLALVRETLGNPTGSQLAHVLEIKTRADSPAWLERLIEDDRVTPAPYSKFVEACHSVQRARAA